MLVQMTGDLAFLDDKDNILALENWKTALQRYLAYCEQARHRAERPHGIQLTGRRTRRREWLDDAEAVVDLLADRACGPPSWRCRDRVPAVEGDIHRYTYRDCHRRARQLASALASLGVNASDRIGTLAWNGYRHLELYYGVSGMGAILHTINPRLHEDQVAYIASHAEDQYIFFDLTFLPLIKAVAGRCKTVKAFIAMTDRAHMPNEAGIENLLCYEDLIEQGSPAYSWPALDEETASTLCYTSGTTGNPKGCSTAIARRCCTPTARRSRMR
jgi:acyl-CoA synthetase (AMP-forming)/AMP-acid ligase II